MARKKAKPAEPPAAPPAPAWTKERRRNAYCLRFGALEIEVHRNMHYARDVWLMTCPAVGLRTLPLDSADIAVAQQEAFAIVANVLRGWRIEMDRFMGTSGKEAT